MGQRVYLAILNPPRPAPLCPACHPRPFPPSIPRRPPPSSALLCSAPLQVVTVPEDYGTADALRAVADKVTSGTFVVLSGDLLSDVPVNALVASHQMHGALATVMLCPRKVCV